MSQARRSRAEWEDIVWKFERTGLSHDAFCEAEGLNVGTFRTWLYKLRHEGGQPEPSFVEVVAGERASGPDACVVRFGQAEARFAHVPDAGYVASLLHALAERPQ